MDYKRQLLPLAVLYPLYHKITLDFIALNLEPSYFLVNKENCLLLCRYINY